MSSNQSLFAEITPSEEANLSGGYCNVGVGVGFQPQPQPQLQPQPQPQPQNVGIGSIGGGTQSGFTFNF